MYCDKCGTLLDDECAFCPTCGVKVKLKNNTTNSATVEKAPVVKAEIVEDKPIVDKGPYKVFAIISFILGFYAIISCIYSFFISFISMSFLGPLGIIMVAMFTSPEIFGVIFGALGLKSTNRKGKAITGLIMNLVGGGISWLLIIVLLV